jgi:hypothetical protein
MTRFSFAGSRNLILGPHWPSERSVSQNTRPSKLRRALETLLMGWAFVGWVGVLN